MPVAEYEKLIRESAVFIPPEKKRPGRDALLVFNPQMEILFSNVVQAVVIYEFSDSHIEVLRVNQAFYDLFGHEDAALNRNALAAVKDEYQSFVLNAFQKTVRSLETAECEYQRKAADGKYLWIRLRLKYVNEVGGKHIVLGCFEDITAQKEIDAEVQKYRTLVRAVRNESGKMLIVDDMETNRDILKAIFAKHFVILEAENGKQALDILRKSGGHVDIILLDLIMPEMDGIEFLEAKRTQGEFAEIPVIITMADEAAGHQVNALALGASDYIIKPFVKKTAVRRVSNVLESNRRF